MLSTLNMAVYKINVIVLLIYLFCQLSEEDTDKRHSVKLCYQPNVILLFQGLMDSKCWHLYEITHTTVFLELV